MAMTMDELHCDLMGMLEVVCHKAVGLTSSDTRVTDGKAGADTYCKLSLVETVATNPKVPSRCEVNGSLHQSTVKTNVEHATLNPHWDQAFKLPVLSDTMMLKAFVYEQDVAGGDKFLGVAEIDLVKDFLLAKEQHAVKKKMFELKADPKHSGKQITGSVELSLAFIPNQNTVVSITVLDGKNISKAIKSTGSTQVKMCGWIVDENGVKSSGSASPLKETRTVIHNGSPKWNTTIYLDHKPSFENDIIRMKILESEQPDCFGVCCPKLCANPNPTIKAIGKVDLPIKELKKEQLEVELASAKKGEYGIKYLTKEMDLLPNAAGGADVTGKVSLYVRYMTPSVREAVRAAKAGEGGLVTPAPVPTPVPVPAPMPTPPPAVARSVPMVAEVDTAADKAKAAAELAEKEAKESAAASLAAKMAKDASNKAAVEASKVQEAAQKEMARVASLAARKPPPVVKATAPAAKARAAPSSSTKPPQGNNMFKKLVRTVMFVAGSQVIKGKFEHPRTTTAKQNSIIATAAGIGLSQAKIPF